MDLQLGTYLLCLWSKKISEDIGTLASKHMPKVQCAWYKKYWIDILGPLFNSALWLCCLVLHSHNIFIGNDTHWYTWASIQHFSLRCPLSSACIHFYCVPIRLKSMVIKIRVQVSNALGRRVIWLILCFFHCFFPFSVVFSLLICILWLFATEGNCIKLTVNACLSEQWAMSIAHVTTLNSVPCRVVTSDGFRIRLTSFCVSCKQFSERKLREHFNHIGDLLNNFRSRATIFDTLFNAFQTFNLELNNAPILNINDFHAAIEII